MTIPAGGIIIVGVDGVTFVAFPTENFYRKFFT